MVELVALRRVAPRPAAQRIPANRANRSSRSAAARGGVVAARQPLALNSYHKERERGTFAGTVSGSPNRDPGRVRSSSPLPARSGYVFSVSRFRVPQGRSKIAQRFIAGLWREHKSSPVRDERTHRSSPIISVAPLGLWPFSTCNPQLKLWATFGRPYRDFGIHAFPARRRRDGPIRRARSDAPHLTTRDRRFGHPPI